MCLNLINSQYKSISEVEELLNNGYRMTEEKIIAMKDDREEIDRNIKLMKGVKELIDLGF